MKTKYIISALALGASTCILTAQGGNPPRDGQGPPPRADGSNETGNARGGDRQRPAETITEKQKEQVKTILSKYQANTLTADQAKAIHEAFRQAGMRGGPVMNDAIQAAGFDPEKLRDLAPPRPEGEPKPGAENGPGPQEPGVGGPQAGGREPQGQGQYSIEQAVSDRAQLTTIAFDGLAFLTGDFGCNTFLPPGKVADFCGFQYMRDVDTNQLGHNTSFVPRAANNVLSILTEKQKAQLVALALEQEKMLTGFVRMRFPLIKAFCRQLEGDIPKSSAGLNREAVRKYTAKIYEIDGLLSYRRAEVLGGIVRTFTDKQKEALAKMAFNNSATWPELPDQVDKKSLSHTAHVAVMTYASEMFSWYAGNVEADVYFCPERHATYFGSFYMKDIPAMGNANYSISTSLTGDSGEAFLATLTEQQRQLVTGLVDRQRADLAEIVTTRRAIATELRRFMKEAVVNKDHVLALSRRYGELDGEISYFYATAFAQVAKTLTAEQKKTLLKLRNLDAKFTCSGAYLYSRAIDMPEVPNTDFLFAAVTAN
ncbi:MAG: hypothetical protein NTV46_19645 [Verrucomicrobia bacterium]|nr:hypothetical protein [Verrucomicrobiota bacterium]